VAVKPRVLTFDVTVDQDRTAQSGLGGTSLAREDEWWPEHFVLAGLLRCTLASIDYSARRAGLDVVGSRLAHGTVTKREDDGLYAFVDIGSELEIEVDPPPGPEALTELIDNAERGCFVSNYLTSKPRHRWTVNGKEIG